MMVHKILPRFYLRRDKRLIAHEVGFPFVTQLPALTSVSFPSSGI